MLISLYMWSNFNDIEYAISAEKKIKGMVRAKKNALIESVNPNWKEIVLE